MSHRIRLGPVAIFLAVVAVVLTTLAVLTTATSNADKAMAERFAHVTEIRYALEDEGQKYIQTVDEGAAAGDVTAAGLDAEETENGMIKKTIEKEGYVLTIVITDPGADGKYDIKEWKMTRMWNAEDPFQNVWQGGK